MFSSPAVRLNNENADATMARKPGLLNQTPFRKAFQDRNVNKVETPVPFSLKTKTCEKAIVKPVTNHPDWLLDDCSWIEIEDEFHDILSGNERLTSEDISRVVFMNFETPPQSPLRIPRITNPDVTKLDLPEKIDFALVEIDEDMFELNF